MIRVLVTGSNGQLGSEFQEIAPQFTNFQFTWTDIEELDISNPAHVDKYLSENRFDAILNCVGYTNVDKAEEEPEQAMLLNCTAVKNLALNATRHNIFLVHISTDYVFNGRNNRPYTETDQPDPISAYARSKTEGEAVFLSHNQRGIIIRLSWLYSRFGNNFVKTILRLSKTRKEINVVSDQVGSPTWAGDFSSMLLSLLPSMIESKENKIYHYSNNGSCSWYELAKAIVEISNRDCVVNPITTEEYPLPAKRPAYSVLDKNKISNDYGIVIPHWRSSLIEMLKK